MSNRIVDLNGAPAKPEPPNVPAMIEAARARWKLGEKHKGFEALCDAMQLLAKGVGRNILDAQKLDAELRELKQKVTPR
jgi:hypothetical protein